MPQNKLIKLCDPFGLNNLFLPIIIIIIVKQKRDNLKENLHNLLRDLLTKSMSVCMLHLPQNIMAIKNDL